MKCPICEKDTEVVRTGKYFGKNVTKQCYQCKECRSYFRESIPHKGSVNQNNALASDSKEG